MAATSRKRKENVKYTDSAEGEYVCHICGHSFYRGCGLASHLRRHAPVSFDCPHCNYTTKHKYAYDRHLAISHSELTKSGPLVDLYAAAYEEERMEAEAFKREIKEEIDYKYDIQVNHEIETKLEPEVYLNGVTRGDQVVNPGPSPQINIEQPVQPKKKKKRKINSNSPSLPKRKIIDLPPTKTKDVYGCPMCLSSFDTLQRAAFHVMCHRQRLHQAAEGTKYHSKKLGTQVGTFKKFSPQMRKWKRLKRVDTRTANERRSQVLWHMEQNFGHRVPKPTNLIGWSRAVVSTKEYKSNSQLEVELNGVTKTIYRKKLRMRCGTDVGQKVVFEESNFYLCRDCPYVTWNASSLWRHFRSHLLRSKQAWTCVSCSFTSMNRNKVDLHVKLHKELPEDEIEFTNWLRHERRVNKTDFDKPMPKRRLGSWQTGPSTLGFHRNSRVNGFSNFKASSSQASSRYTLPIAFSRSSARNSRKIIDPSTTDLSSIITYDSINPRSAKAFSRMRVGNGTGPDTGLAAQIVKVCSEKYFSLPENSKFCEMNAPEQAEDSPPQLDEPEETLQEPSKEASPDCGITLEQMEVSPEYDVNLVDDGELMPVLAYSSDTPTFSTCTSQNVDFSISPTEPRTSTESPIEEEGEEEVIPTLRSTRVLRSRSLAAPPVLKMEAFEPRTAFDSQQSEEPPVLQTQVPANPDLVEPIYEDFVYIEGGGSRFPLQRHYLDALDLYQQAWMKYERAVKTSVIRTAVGVNLLKNLHPAARVQVGRNNPREYLAKEIEIEESRECPDCPYKNSNLNRFRRHRDHHFYGGRHVCDECNYACSHPHQLQDHMFVTHYLSDVKLVEELSSSSSEYESTPPPMSQPAHLRRKKGRRRRTHWTKV